MSSEKVKSGGDTTRLIPEEELSAVRKAGEHRRVCLIVVAGDEIGREHNLNAPEMIIGRSETAGVRVHSRSVSRQHAQISRVRENNDEYFRVIDLGSMNGTQVNNVTVASANLHDGDKIQVGDVVFKFVVQDAVDAEFHREIHRLIHFDQLTGLMTMESFRRVLEEEIQRARHGHIFTLAMTDLDGLKRVNDTHGHLAGRMIVEAMGLMFRETLRSADHAGLYGGDEAIVLYPQTPAAEAQQVAERLRKTIERRIFEHNDASFSVTISQGMAEWPRHGASAEAIIAAADSALYAAKAAGRNCIRVSGEPEVLSTLKS